VRFLKRFGSLVLLTIISAACAVWSWSQEPPAPHQGQYGFTLLRTADGEIADPMFFISNETCVTCHPRQGEEFQGSFHSASHEDPLYRQFALLAQKEAGDAMYTYCSGCHAPAGVVTEMIPHTPDAELPEEIKGGVTCDVCHQISSLTGHQGPWQQEGNASFVLEPGLTRFGNYEKAKTNRLHASEKKAFYATSEYCASCHTVIHPVNGLMIENTYQEWKESIYAERGIQCQHCHMNSVEDAVRVAETLQPVVRIGQSATKGPDREIHPHYFVGANVDANRLTHGPLHAKMAVARLKSAARIEVVGPKQFTPGQELRIEVSVHNVAAGHNIPTGATELRQMWVDLQVLDASGRTLFRTGKLDEHGELPSDAIWFGAVAVDTEGRPTAKPWEMNRFLRQRAIPPKGAVRETISTQLPAEIAGPLTVEAKLLYRSVAPHVVDEVMGEGAFHPTITEMAQTSTVVPSP
jgi:hypothetical protein